MTNEKRKTEGDAFTVIETVDALITSLRTAGYDFNYETYTFKYHIDIGILVLFRAEEVPNFPVDTAWLIDGSGFDWMLNSVEKDIPGSMYDVVFLLEVEI